MTGGYLGGVVDVAHRFTSSPDYAVATLARAVIALSKFAPRCECCNGIATMRGHAESEDEADAADPFTTQPIARRWLQRCEEHARGLHDVEPIHVVGSPP